MHYRAGHSHRTHHAPILERGDRRHRHTLGIGTASGLMSAGARSPRRPFAGSARSLEERRAEQRQEKAKMQARLATMEPLLGSMTVPLKPPRSSEAIKRYLGEASAARGGLQGGGATDLDRPNSQWPPRRGQVCLPHAISRCLPRPRTLVATHRSPRL
jgi:hypothetical protein